MKLQLEAIRKQSGKIQAQVAKEAKISTSQYQNIAYGKNEPSVRTAIRIADALQVKTYQEFRDLFGAATPDEETASVHAPYRGHT